jgi:hypothetical protein
MVMVAGLLVAWTLGFAALAPDDCKECSPRHLCSAHSAEEANVLKSTAPLLKSSDETQRTKALEQIAHLKDAHANAPSPAAAKALAVGLSDSSWHVRTKTVQLLAGQDHDATVELLGRALEDARKNDAKLMTFATDDAMTPDQKGLTEYLKVTSEAIVATKDDRSARALIDFLKHASFRMPVAMIVPIVQAAGNLGTADAFEVVIERLANAETVGGLRNFHDVLVAAATAHQGKDLPEWSAGNSSHWKKWFEAHRKLFPEKLAKA